MQQSWIEAKVKGSETGVIVVPAFDDSTRGASMNRSEPLGPFLKNMVDLEDAEVYLLDGSYLGVLGDLKIKF